MWLQAPSEPQCLVVPSSLQLGWVESALYFCMASETAQDAAVQYIKTKVGLLRQHKFEGWAGAELAFVNSNTTQRDLCYFLEVHVNDYIACIVSTSKEQIKHIAREILHGIYDMYPPSTDNSKDPILAKKLRKGNGTFESNKCLLGFNFDGVNKTMWLEKEKRVALLTVLHQWSRGATKSKRGIQFAEFKSMTAKLRHAFAALREGQGLPSPCNWVIQKPLQVIYLHYNGVLLEVIQKIRTILRASIQSPTQFKDLSWVGRTTLG